MSYAILQNTLISHLSLSSLAKFDMILLMKDIIFYPLILKD